MQNMLLRMLGLPNRNALASQGLRFSGGQSLGLAPYGVRHDGSAAKGRGFFGPLPNNSGDVMTEYTIGVDLNGRPMEIPTFVPTLTKSELSHLLGGGDVTDAIYEKAYKHAVDRIGKKKSPFRETGEFYY